MKHFLIVLGYGAGGILAALALSLGAFALAGRQIGEPATPVRPAFSLSASPTATGAPSMEATPTSTSSPSHDDSGSSGNSGSGGEDHPDTGHHGGEDD